MKPRTLALVPMIAAVPVTLSGEALAYVGPGAGITMLGALWAVVAALAMVLFGLGLWPVRAFLRYRRRHGAVAAKEAGEG